MAAGPGGVGEPPDGARDVEVTQATSDAVEHLAGYRCHWHRFGADSLCSHFGATSVPGVLELDGSWMRGEGQAREEDASRVGDEEPSDLVHASILRREFIFDAPLKEAVERGWMMTLTFGGFSGPLYALMERSLVSARTVSFLRPST